LFTIATKPPNLKLFIPDVVTVYPTISWPEIRALQVLLFSIVICPSILIPFWDIEWWDSRYCRAGTFSFWYYLWQL